MTLAVREFCASCGHEMERRPDGAWTPSCSCRQVGYWATAKPLPADMWCWHGISPIPVDGQPAYFYPGPLWPWPRLPAMKLVPTNGR